MIIVTDSAADLRKEEAAALGIQIAPLQIQFPERGVSSDEITPDEFYSRLEAMQPNIPTTSQPSPGTFASLYAKLSELKEEILSIHISSGLSGTIESARMGAKQILDANIQLVDSLTLSGGERFQVIAAALAAQAGWSRSAILDHLKKVREATEVVYTLETITYLARGGRIGRVQALAGSILKLKPVITVDKKDGKYNTLGKERTMTKALESIRDHLVRTYGVDLPLYIAIMHGQFSDQAGILYGMLEEKLNIAKMEVLRISPALGVHTGPGVVGAAAIPAALLAGLE